MTLHVVTDATMFPYLRAHEIDQPDDTCVWDIESLWTRGGVGIVGGCPKSLKTWTALEIAVSMASGTPCLGRFRVSNPGPVLIYAAEDALVKVRERLDGLCRARGVDLASVPVHVITVPSMRLDRPGDRERLRNTVVAVRPRLLVLDPLVRVYGRVDENSAAEVSRFLAYLREIQREFETAVLLVHHARKVQGDASPGQALRGSGDLHAWVDDLLYLKRTHDGLRLTVEHRSAPSISPLLLELSQEAEHPPHLRILTTEAAGPDLALDERILLLLARNSAPLTAEEIRETLSVRKKRVLTTLKELHDAGKIQRVNRRWCRPARDPDSADHRIRPSAGDRERSGRPFG